jgi:hypothetical protein
MSRRKTGNENMPPTATQPSMPPAATITPSIADLAGEQAEAFNRGLVGLAGKLLAGIAALEISPVALRFKPVPRARCWPK